MLKQSVVMEAQGIIPVFHQPQSLQTVCIHLNGDKVYINTNSWNLISWLYN